MNNRIKSDEQQMLKDIYEKIQQALSERKRGAAWIFAEPLRLELWESLEQWERFLKRARSRLDEEFPEQSTEQVLEKQKPDCSKQQTQNDIICKILSRDQKVSIELKYAIHHWKHAGIYATELAKEIIEFQESEVENLKKYL